MSAIQDEQVIYQNWKNLSKLVIYLYNFLIDYFRLLTRAVRRGPRPLPPHPTHKLGGMGGGETNITPVLGKGVGGHPLGRGGEETPQGVGECHPAVDGGRGCGAENLCESNFYIIYFKINISFFILNILNL